jgi:hypothetical protein
VANGGNATHEKSPATGVSPLQGILFDEKNPFDVLCQT